jgi:hypothetical protein
MSQILRLFFELFIVTLVATSCLTTLFFIVAENPETAAKSGSHWPIPVGAEAVVSNHGSYIKWYLLSLHPILFLISVGGIFVGSFLINYMWKK